MKLKSVTISFNVDSFNYSFNIYHNLPDFNGLSIEDALNSWVYRTKEYSAKSFCDYVNSKNSGYVAITEKQFKRMFE